MSQASDFIGRHDYPCWCAERRAHVFCQQLFGRRHFMALTCAVCGTQRLLPKAIANDAAAETLYNEYTGAEPGDVPGFANRMLARLEHSGIRFARGQRVLDVG